MTSPQDRIAPFELDPKQLDPAQIELVEPDTGTLPAVREPDPPPPPTRPWARLLWGAGGLLLALLLGLEAYDWLTYWLARSPFLGGLGAGLIGLTVAGALGLLAREWLSLRRLARLEDFRHEAQRMLGSSVHGQADRLLQPIERLYRDREPIAARIERFHATASDALDDGERLQLFARTVLAPLDRRAYQLVKNAARDIGALTALSPLGLLDSAIVLARTLMMLRAIARLYGVRPGAVASLALLRRALRNVLAAGVGELLSDAAVETVGASLLSVLSARAGQGVVNGLLAARLGLSAMQLCRPLPFQKDELPSFKQLRAEIFAQSGAKDRAAPAERRRKP